MSIICPYAFNFGQNTPILIPVPVAVTFWFFLRIYLWEHNYQLTKNL